MSSLTATGTHTCTCGHPVRYEFWHNGYAEKIVFVVDGRGVRDCPECGERLVYRD